MVCQMERVTFMDCLQVQIPDMNIWKAPAPPNPIVDQGFTGFTFAPRQKYYSMFKNGILAKLAVCTDPSDTRSLS